ncbi:MAG: hypothetical protein J0I12_28695 [Candidatus Eremiobacteraeota bacterium]|nr:hypothetical protein [Candidatus Eremiobacteraeota bacterium]
MELRAELERLEGLLPYCLENRRRRREFIEGVARLPEGGMVWLLLQGYRLALMGQTETARQYFLQGYFQCREVELRARFHWAALSLERAYPRPADLDEMCQWLSGALHDGPAQSLALNGSRELAREMAELAQWLRNPLLEGQSLEAALQDYLGGWQNVTQRFERAPAPLEKLFFRVFQEVAEARGPLRPQHVQLQVQRGPTRWRASWTDEIASPCRLPTLRARVAQLGGRSRLRLDQGFTLSVSLPRRHQKGYL